MEFADIALAKFLQAAPELGPLILNFSEVDNDMGDAGSEIKVGVFILKAGGGLAYVPVINKGETVFPMDSIFLEQEGIFRPLSPSTVNYLINTASASLGKSTKIPTSVDQNPSLSSLVAPPRTGKFVYASASRLPEFLAVVPQGVRKQIFEKIAGEQSLYTSLDKLFGLKAIFSVLNGNSGGSGATNSTATGPELISRTQFSVATLPQEIQALKSDEATKNYLDHGYVIQGGGGTLRSAVSYFPYDKIGSYLHVAPLSDGGKNYRITMGDGSTKDAFLPEYHLLNPIRHKDSLVSVFVDGTYARGEMIAASTPLLHSDVLKVLFELNPPKLLRDLSRGEEFLMFTTSGEALGPFRANSVTRTSQGVEVGTFAGRIKRICGFTNFTKEVDSIGDTLFLPSNVIVVVLGSDISDQLERSINSALNKSEIKASQFLGEEINLRYDGVEFSTDKRVLGKFASAIKYLVEGEQIEPDVAENFLKQAQETSFLKLFLSKAASTDFAPQSIPQYGAAPMDQQEAGLDGSFLPAVQSSTGLGDAQAVECTIISQLLQVPELFEYIQEYLPEIEQTVDRLGRILFLTRVKIDQISGALDSDSVFTLISQIKTVYRQLGDTSLKLKGIANATVGFNKEDAEGRPKGT
jgi:hypothetical protein